MNTLQVAIVTGASSGIGKACAIELAKKNYAVVLAARNTEKLESVRSMIQKTYQTPVLSVACDVSQESDCQRLIQESLDAFQRIDILVNNAGISMRALFKDLDLSVLKQVMDINFWGAVYCTKYAMPALLQSKGSIVGVSSIAGYRGLPARTGYSASKFALQGFLEALRTENLKTGLHVLIACPGFTASNIRNTALSADGGSQGESPRDEGKMMTAEEVAQRIVRATLARKKTLIMTSQGKMTVFLNKWFNGFMDKMVYNHMAKEPDSPFK